MKKKAKPLKKSKQSPKKGPIKREDFLLLKEAPEEGTEDIPVMESLEVLAEKEAETDFDDDLDSPDDRY